MITMANETEVVKREYAAWVVATQRVETPYAVTWQGAKGLLLTGRVVGVSGDCYVVEGKSHKPTYSWGWRENVRIVDALPAIGGAACCLDVDAMLWACWDDGSEREGLRNRLERFEFDLNSVGGWQYE